MKRLSGKALAATSGALVAAVLLGAGVWRMASSAGESVATFRVEKGRFVRETWATGTLKAERATPVAVPIESMQSQKIAFIVRDGAVVKKGDILVRFDPYDAERAAADGRSDASSAAHKLEKTNVEGKKTTKNLELDQKLAADELDRAQRFELKDPTIFSRYELVESSISKDLAGKKSDAASRKSATSSRLVSADLAVGQVEADKAALRLRQADKVLKALSIEAPHDGLLMLERTGRGEVPYVGNTVWPGMKLGELPDLAVLQARVHVLEADAAGLVVGLPATVEIEGRPGQSWPGKVSRVEPIAKPRGRESPVKYFECIISLDATDTAVMRPGQRVRALVRLEEADGVLAVPRGALFEKDGKRVVYRKKTSGGFEPTEVEVGRNSLSRIVIEKGLSSGDRIALRDPTTRTASPSGPSGGLPTDKKASQ